MADSHVLMSHFSQWLTFHLWRGKLPESGREAGNRGLGYTLHDTISLSAVVFKDQQANSSQETSLKEKGGNKYLIQT